MAPKQMPMFRWLPGNKLASGIANQICYIYRFPKAWSVARKKAKLESMGPTTMHPTKQKPNMQLQELLGQIEKKSHMPNSNISSRISEGFPMMKLKVRFLNRSEDLLDIFYRTYSTQIQIDRVEVISRQNTIEPMLRKQKNMIAVSRVSPTLGQLYQVWLKKQIKQRTIMPAEAALQPIKNSLSMRGDSVWATRQEESNPVIVKVIQGSMLQAKKHLTPAISDSILIVAIVISTWMVVDPGMDQQSSLSSLSWVQLSHLQLRTNQLWRLSKWVSWSPTFLQDSVKAPLYISSALSFTSERESRTVLTLLYLSIDRGFNIILFMNINLVTLLLHTALLSLVLCGVRINHNLMLVDDLGRELMIHGGCVVVKIPPYFPILDHFDSDKSFATRDYEIYKELGMNGVRFGAMWAGVQPKKDWYNTTYLEQMVKFINKLGENGIYTLVDFHQDIISEKFCGDGIPVWLIDEIKGYKTFPYPWSLKKMPMNASGMPDWKNCDQGNWAKYYLTSDVGNVFNHLYDTNHYVHKKFVNYWKTVAKYLKGNPYVIAYELINQPFVGNAVRDPLLLIPTVAQRVKFQRFYDSVAKGIRQVDNDTNICIQPITFDFEFNSGFNHAPGGNLYRDKSILCYHYESPPVRSLKTMQAKLRDKKRLGIPVLMSQFGGYEPARQFVQDHLQSYFYWQYKSFGKGWGNPKNKASFFASKEEGGLGLVNPDGSIAEDEVPNVARTTLHRTAGALQKMTYRVQTGHFNAVYEATPGGTSILYMSRNRVYKKGYSMDIQPKDSIKIKEDGNYIAITYTGAEKRLIMINIQKL